jgi:dTDP-4-dehydrorhamnose 3,5-epimerase
MIDKPNIIKGNHYKDERGVLRFVNDFPLTDIKRFYLIKHPDTNIVRAWQGHEFERKYFYAIRGSFVIAWVKIDDFENPSELLSADYQILSDQNSEILSIPAGYANGLKALSPDSELLVFSDFNLEQTKAEKKTYPSEQWFDWEQEFS